MKIRRLESIDNQRFTLVELMVVLAIIGILMSLLLPSLGRARRTARQAVCAQQLHQIGVAAALYSQENNGKILSASAVPDLHGLRGWNEPLAPYLGINYDASDNQAYKIFKGQGIFACPSSKVNNTKLWSNGGIGWNPEVGHVLKGDGGSGIVNINKAIIVRAY
jgi:prepilin-type N-terminal cleavage/methylation domain-containing protein